LPVDMVTRSGFNDTTRVVDPCDNRMEFE